MKYTYVALALAFFAGSAFLLGRGNPAIDARESSEVVGGPRTPQVLLSPPLANSEDRLVMEVPEGGGDDQALELPAAPIFGPEIESADSAERRYQEKYGTMGPVELDQAFTLVSTEMGQLHQSFVLDLIARGYGELVDEEDWSFKMSDDPDVVMGGHTDGEHFYKVPITRAEAPELFAVKAEYHWLQSWLHKKARHGGHGD